MDVDATRSRVRLGILHRVVRQSFDNLALLVRGTQGFFGTFIKVEVILGNNDVNIGNMPQLAQFQRCELHLGGATTAKDVNVSNGVFSKTLCNVFRDLGHKHIFRVLCQDTGNIQSNISHAQNGYGLRFQRPSARVVRMTVVPGDKVSSTVGLGQINTGDIQRGIAVSTGCDDDRVVVRMQVIDSDVATNLNIAQKTNITALQDLVQGDNDLLDSRVIGSNTVADQTIGGGKAFKQVNIHVQTGFGQNIRCIDASRSSADDGYVVGAHSYPLLWPPRKATLILSQSYN